MKHSEIDQLLVRTFPEGVVYAVGGRVRDELLIQMGHSCQVSQDADYLITSVPLNEMETRLSRHGRVELVGASFGVLKFTSAGTTVDVALPRRERSVGPHHRDFDVQSAPDIPLEEDLSRRDFRINMIARRVSDAQIVDPFNGLDDLRNKRLDIVKPEVFLEDPLRILRGAQFAARFNLQPTPQTIAAMREAAPLIRTVAAERIADEITKLLTRAERPSTGIEVLREVAALTYVMPELLEGWGVEQNQFHRYTVYYHSMRCMDEAPKDLVVRLAALLHDIAKPRTKSGPHFYRHELVGEKMAQELLGRLRFSSDIIQRVTWLIKHHMFSSEDAMTDAAVRRFIARVGADAIPNLFALRRADILGSGLPERNPSELDRFAGRVYAELEGTTAFGVTELAIDGAAVIALMRQLGIVDASFRGDARVGAVLRHCLEIVLEHPEQNSTAVLEAVVRAYFSAEASHAD